MIIQQDEKFSKLLGGMAMAGGNAALAARNAVRIIEILRAKGAAGLQETGRRTKYGEKRLRNCIKFNLGNGYRLISVRRNDALLLLHLGSHDECDAWLEKNRGCFFSSEHIDPGASCPLPQSGSAKAPGGRGKSREQERDGYEELLLRKIDDRLLRRIFSGLLKNRNEPNP